MPSYDLIIIGAGIAGMTAAMGAAKQGVKKILVLEQESNVGGIINQCIHNGFGQKLLSEQVTGPEYVSFIEKQLEKTNAEVILNANVLGVTKDKVVTYVNPKCGVKDESAGAIVFAMGAKERYSGSIIIPTNGLNGIFTVGEAQRIVNLEGYLPGRKTIIIAKDKWGFIVARRLIIEGGKVEALILENPSDKILNPEINKIIDGFDVNIIENSRITEIEGKNRIKKIKIMNLYDNQIVEKECDSLLLSVDFVPENSMLKKLKIDLNDKTLGPKVSDFKTSLDGFFACGNIIYGQDAMNMEEVNGIECGIKAAEYIQKYIY